MLVATAHLSRSSESVIPTKEDRGGAPPSSYHGPIYLVWFLANLVSSLHRDGKDLGYPRRKTSLSPVADAL